MENSGLASLIKISFPFSNDRMPDKLSNASYSTVYSVIGAELLQIARASNNNEPVSP